MLPDQARPVPIRKKRSFLKIALRKTLLYLAPWILRTLCATYRLQVEDRSGLRPEEPRVMVAWHEHLAALVPYGLTQKDRFTLLVSPSRDGTAGTDLAAKMGVKTVRGSSSRGGLGALKNLVRELRDGAWIGILADGPRGPAREMKPGAVMLAAMGRVTIVPVVATCSPHFRIKSWDRTIIPYPFAKIRVLLGEAQAPCENTDRDLLSCQGIHIANLLNQYEQELLSKMK
jgi:lysophospholipid acyltransferase (LPLAT)-like uncharacterized protein